MLSRAVHPSPVKRSSTLALIAVAVAYLLGLQFLHYERAVARERSAMSVAAPPRPMPSEPAARPAAQDRRIEFGGYPCRDEQCSEDWAGYRWAQQNAIADADDCTGKTGSFIEGCRVYARQQTR